MLQISDQAKCSVHRGRPTRKDLRTGACIDTEWDVDCYILTTIRRVPNILCASFNRFAFITFRGNA